MDLLRHSFLRRFRSVLRSAALVLALLAGPWGNSSSLAAERAKVVVVAPVVPAGVPLTELKEAERALAEARKHLEVLQALLEERPGPAIQSAAQRKTVEVDRALHRLEEVLARLAQPAELPAQAAAAPGPEGASPSRPEALKPMEDGDFQRLLAAMQSETFSEPRMAVLRNAAAAAWFTTAQLRQVVPLFTFGHEKVEAMVVVHPRLLDPERTHELFSLLDFDADKKELRKRLGLP